MDWAVVVPMANEENEFIPFVSLLSQVMDELDGGHVYFVVDSVSKDATFDLCRSFSASDKRFTTIWSQESTNVVTAYLKGYQVAYKRGHHFILEMDAGLSHDPRELPAFLKELREGYPCAFGSRFIQGGSMKGSYKRIFLSKFGTLLANVLLGTKLSDMTSGYQGFHRDVVKLFIAYPLKSKAHFYQTEIRYLLRNKRYIEVPIHYQAPSPSVSKKAIENSWETLLFYARNRFLGKKTAL